MDCLHVHTTEAVFAPRLSNLSEVTRNVFDPEEELIDELPSPPPARRRLGQPLNCFDIGFSRAARSASAGLGGMSNRAPSVPFSSEKGKQIRCFASKVLGNSMLTEPLTGKHGPSYFGRGLLEPPKLFGNREVRFMASRKAL